jgi:DNA (cytosine-5)-methyltransferase 1
MNKEARVIGGLGEKKSNGGTQYFQQDRVYYGDIAMSHPAQLPSGSYNYLVEEKTVRIKEATKKGYAECNVGGVADLLYPSSTTRKGRVQGNGEICPTLTAEESGVHRIESVYRIRKLTPLECWRLMDFSDEDFYKAESVCSNTQLYKQAGNSIVKNVLVAIFGQMIEGKENVYKKMEVKQ